MIVQIYESFELTGELNLFTLQASGEGIKLLERIKAESIIYIGDNKPLTLKDQNLAKKLSDTYDNPYYLVVIKE